MEDSIKFSITLTALAVAFAAGMLLNRMRPFRALSQRKDRDVTLDGLRGYLALSVFFHHVAVTHTWKSTGVWASSPDIYFLNYGKVGVYIFFMITGYLFVGKLLRAGPGRVDWLRLYESRLFRIFPLYLSALAVISLVVFAASGWQLQVPAAQLAVDYFRWGIFHGSTINGFADTQIIIALVDWTLKYEWLFYAALPIVAAGLRMRHGGLVLLILCLALYVMPVQLKQFNSAYLLLFALGGLVAWIKQQRPTWLRTTRHSAASWLALALAAAALFYPNTMDAWHVAMIALFFLIVASGNDLFGLLTHPASLVLGEISYSIYLLHGIVLYLLFTTLDPISFSALPLARFLLLMPALTLLVVAIAALTYAVIEQPALMAGRRYRLSAWLKDWLRVGRARSAGQAAPGVSRP